MNGSSVLVPEILPAGVSVVARQSPFTFDRAVLELPAGLTLSQILEQAIKEPWLRSWAAVAVDGVLVSSWALPFHRTKAGEHVTIVVVPRGGGGEGGQGKNTWAVVLSVVVILAASALTYGGAGPAIGTALGFTGPTAAAVGGVVIAGGSLVALLAVNALLPPSRPCFQPGNSPRPTVAPA
jgi:hypothetical protein